jgi:hypothetical protein
MTPPLGRGIFMRMRIADSRSQATSRPVLRPLSGQLVAQASWARAQRDLVIASLLRCPPAPEKQRRA